MRPPDSKDHTGDASRPSDFRRHDVDGHWLRARVDRAISEITDMRRNISWRSRLPWTPTRPRNLHRVCQLDDTSARCGQAGRMGITRLLPLAQAELRGARPLFSTSSASGRHAEAAFLEIVSALNPGMAKSGELYSRKCRTRLPGYAFSPSILQLVNYSGWRTAYEPRYQRKWESCQNSN